MADNERTIADFLESPDDYHRFLSFFELTFHMARAYLRRLQARGWKLPLQEYSDETGIDDCTVDLLATLYRSDNGRPYYVIRDHFERSNAQHDSLFDQLKSLVAGHIHQELDRVKNALNESAFHIKRQIVYALKSGDYEEVSLGALRCWRWTGGGEPRLDGHPLADKDQVQQWALAAVREQANMPQRVRAVFELLQEDTTCATALPQYALTTAFRAVLCDPGDHPWGIQPLPGGAYVKNELRRLAALAIEQSNDECLAKQGEKKGLSETVFDAYGRSLKNLMRDWIEHGEHDKIPQYLYEQIDGLDSKQFLKLYKYSFETLVEDCKERLREMVRAKGLEP